MSESSASLLVSTSDHLEDSSPSESQMPVRTHPFAAVSYDNMRRWPGKKDQPLQLKRETAHCNVSFDHMYASIR